MNTNHNHLYSVTIYCYPLFVIDVFLNLNNLFIYGYKFIITTN